MSDFPPRDFLMHVARTIVGRLPDDYAHLLAAEHFSEEAAVLARLARPEHLAAGAAAMDLAEARWLADRLLARWGRIGEARLGPAVAIAGPDEIWLSDEPRTIAFSLATLGIEEGWEAQWMGDVSVAEDGCSATLMLDPPAGEEPVAVTIGVRLMGRAAGERCALSASKSIRLRRPVVTLDESRRQLSLRDRSGDPGARVELEVAGEVFTTDATGSLVLPQALPEETILGVDGAAVYLRGGGGA